MTHTSITTEIGLDHPLRPMILAAYVSTSPDLPPVPPDVPIEVLQQFLLRDGRILLELTTAIIGHGTVIRIGALIP